MDSSPAFLCFFTKLTTHLSYKHWIARDTNTLSQTDILKRVLVISEYDDYVPILGGSVHTIKENAKALVVTRKEMD
jgi:hypothetical protein